MTSSAKVFVSYAHELDLTGHRQRALELAQSLRTKGVEASIDQYVEHDPPFWPRWTLDEIQRADYVLCLASPTYKVRTEGRGDHSIGRGSRWEGAFITEAIYADIEQNQRKYIAVVLEQCSADDIPDVLMPLGLSYYFWPADEAILYGRLTGQRLVKPAPLGEIVLLGS